MYGQIFMPFIFDFLIIYYPKTRRTKSRIFIILIGLRGLDESHLLNYSFDVIKYSSRSSYNLTRSHLLAFWRVILFYFNLQHFTHRLSEDVKAKYTKTANISLTDAP